MTQLNPKANSFSNRDAAAAQVAAVATEALMEQASSGRSPGCHIPCLRHVFQGAGCNLQCACHPP